MKTKKVKTVKTLLEANGWTLSRVRGGHAIYRKVGAPRSIPVPGKDSDDLAIGTLKSILRQAGLTEDDFPGI